ncbi:MAG: hypothetical protein HW387_1549 [Parachlamydiales bacterium]|nr:hypothetical protein [Parachlamydiales bacterium]
MKRTKRAAILLEMIIALGLTAILLSVLFRFFAGSVRMDQKVDTARTQLYQRQHFQMRMATILNSMVPRSSMSPPKGSSFYTVDEKMPGFITIFDNGIDPDPLYSGPILGKVFLDLNGNLTLALWPLEKQEKNIYRTEILLSNVQKIRFQFLAKKSLQHTDSKAIPINSTLEWRTNWPQNCWDIPSMIRLIIDQNNQETGFAFALPSIEPIITYHENGVKG